MAYKFNPFTANFDEVSEEDLSGYLLLDGSNANTTIDIGSEDFVTDGTITGSPLVSQGVGAIATTIDGSSITCTIATITFGSNNLTTTGLGTFGSLDVDSLNFNQNIITDSTGTISFDDELLITRGEIHIDSDVSKLKLGESADAEIYYNGSKLIIDDTATQEISFEDNNLTTTGTITSENIEIINDTTDGGGRGMTITRNKSETVRSALCVLRRYNDGDKVDNTEAIGEFAFQGWDGVQYQDSSRVYAYVDGVTSVGVVPIAVEIQTGTASWGTARLTVASGGDFDFHNNNLNNILTADIGNITIAGAAITSNTGAISFNDETLITTGLANFGTLKVGDGGTTNYAQINATGDVSFAGSAGFYPRLIRQDAEPANGTGATQIDDEELIMWIDTNDSDKVYLMYNDNTNTNIVKIELT